jgi:hypothetical protein
MTVVAGTGLVLVTSIAAPAFADPTPTAPPTTAKTCSADRLAYVKARVDAAVKAREVTIDSLTRRLAARTHVSGPHRATLTATYTADASGLRTVDATVQADTTCAQAVTDGRTVVTSYRVYRLLVPQTHLVSASDTGTYAAGQLAAAEPKAQAAIDALTDPQKKATAQSELDDLTAQVTAATASFAGVADGMLALSPADIPAKESVIDGYRSKVAAGHADLAKALADANSLKALLGNV